MDLSDSHLVQKIIKHGFSHGKITDLTSSLTSLAIGVKQKNGPPSRCTPLELHRFDFVLTF